MGDTKRDQINISFPKGWKEKLERLAREISIKEDKTINHLDLIRKAVKERYNLDNNEK